MCAKIRVKKEMFLLQSPVRRLNLIIINIINYTQIFARVQKKMSIKVFILNV